LSNPQVLHADLSNIPSGTFNTAKITILSNNDQEQNPVPDFSVDIGTIAQAGTDLLNSCCFSGTNLCVPAEIVVQTPDGHFIRVQQAVNPDDEPAADTVPA
jgi:hypothetical protein